MHWKLIIFHICNDFLKKAYGTQLGHSWSNSTIGMSQSSKCASLFSVLCGRRVSLNRLHEPRRWGRENFQGASQPQRRFGDLRSKCPKCRFVSIHHFSSSHRIVSRYVIFIVPSYCAILVLPFSICFNHFSVAITHGKKHQKVFVQWCSFFPYNAFSLLYIYSYTLNFIAILYPALV